MKCLDTDRAELARRKSPNLLREFVDGEWKEAHFDRYKPSARKGVHDLLSGRILPEFGSKTLDRITSAQLSRWFDAFSHTAPGNANHALALLPQIMNFAVARGYIEKNPTQGIRPNRRPKLIRPLSRSKNRPWWSYSLTPPSTHELAACNTYRLSTNPARRGATVSASKRVRLIDPRHARLPELHTLATSFAHEKAIKEHREYDDRHAGLEAQRQSDASDGPHHSLTKPYGSD